jgi:hypothetical protein
LTIAYKENDIKQEARKIIEDKLATIKNQDDLEVLKDLNRAISKICA